MAFGTTTNKSEILQMICNDTGVDKDNAQIILEFISKSENLKNNYSSSMCFPDSKPGVMQMMVMIQKYNINISELLLKAIACLLGLTPGVGAIMTGADVIQSSLKCVKELSEDEKACIIFLRKICYDSNDYVDIGSIYESFISEKKFEYKF